MTSGCRTAQRQFHPLVHLHGGGATIAPEEHIAPERAHDAAGVDWDNAVENAGCCPPTAATTTRRRSCAATRHRSCCRLGALNFGGEPAAGHPWFGSVPQPVSSTPTANLRPVDSPFSAFVFKVQAGMDSAHRDRIAYARVCSGTFERGDVLTHAATGNRSSPSTRNRFSANSARRWTARGPVT